MLYEKMKNKKGVLTSVVLTIGLIVLAAIVLFSGTRIATYYVKTTAEYSAYELSLSMNSVYSAPENASYFFKFFSNESNFLFGDYLLSLEQNNIVLERGIQSLSIPISSLEGKVNYTGCVRLCKLPTNIALKKEYGKNLVVKTAGKNGTII